MAADVVVTFAGTLLQVTRVRGARYVLDAPPLVIDTTRARVIEHGLVRVEVRPVTTPRVPLARRAFEVRPVPFLIASLAAHVALVLVAMARLALEPVTIAVDITDPPRLPTHVARIQPTPKPEPKPAAATAGGGGAAAEPQAAATGAPTLEGVFGSLDDLSGVMGKADLAKELADVGPVYDEEAANANNFGGAARKFDPSTDPAFDSVKTGRYATVSGGRGAGAHYKLPGEVGRPPLMALACDDDKSCVVEGTLNRHAVRDLIEKRYVDLVKCYERTSQKVPHVEITLRFDIGEDGKAGEIAVDGLEPVGSCVARIVARTKFPASEQPTRVKTYPMAFWKT